MTSRSERGSGMEDYRASNRTWVAMTEAEDDYVGHLAAERNRWQARAEGAEQVVDELHEQLRGAVEALEQIAGLIAFKAASAQDLAYEMTQIARAALDRLGGGNKHDDAARLEHMRAALRAAFGGR